MAFAFRGLLDHNVMRVVLAWEQDPFATPWMVTVAALVVVKGRKPETGLDVGGGGCCCCGSKKTNGARMMMCVCACVCACATRLLDSYGGRLLARWICFFASLLCLLCLGLACGR